jgi:hypothetical protein
MQLSDYLKSIGAKPSRWAQQHKISPSIISRYLNQKAGLELGTAHRIIKATNGAVSLDDLFCGMTNDNQSQEA